MPIQTECMRCKADLHCHTMSRFNLDIICLHCEEIEKAHPDYAAACAVEHEEVLRGNYNYPGIGMPEALLKQSLVARIARENLKAEGQKP